LQDKVTQLSTDFGRLVREVSSLRSAAAGIQTLSEEVCFLTTQIVHQLPDSVVEQLSTSQMPNHNAKRLSGVLVHRASRKANPWEELACRRKPIFSESRSDASSAALESTAPGS
jgi:hypothetical protein